MVLGHCDADGGAHRGGAVSQSAAAATKRRRCLYAQVASWYLSPFRRFGVGVGGGYRHQLEEGFYFFTQGSTEFYLLEAISQVGNRSLPSALWQGSADLLMKGACVRMTAPVKVHRRGEYEYRTHRERCKGIQTSRERMELKLGKIEQRLGDKLYVRVKLDSDSSHSYTCGIHFQASGHDFNSSATSSDIIKAEMRRWRR